MGLTGQGERDTGQTGYTFDLYMVAWPSGLVTLGNGFVP